MDLKALLCMQITPFRFVGSTAMMKRLRTASSPYLQPLSKSQIAMDEANGEINGPEGTDMIAAIGLDKLKGNADLLPPLPIPPRPAVCLIR